MRRIAILVAGLAVLPGCLSADRTFTDGRIGTLCEQTIPVCGDTASCILGDTNFADGTFPGGLSAIVRSEFDAATAVVRILLTDARYAGTELSVRIYGAGCADYEEERYVDVNILEISQPDGIVEAALPIEGRGDHLLEIFSDSAANYLLTVETVERTTAND